MWRVPVLVAMLTGALGTAAAGEGPQAGPSAGGDKVTILGPASYWRWHFTWKTPLVRRSSGELEHGGINWWARPLAFVKAKEAQSSAPPPKGWAVPEFADGAWVRARGPMGPGIVTRRGALICARGNFEVADPVKAGELEFTLAYQGGAVVYINGEEVARKHLPAGPLEPDTPAEDYPREAYVTAEGEGICGWGFGHPEKYKDRIALRGREVQVKIPAAKLRKGANVIAVKVHRAPVSEIMFTSKWNDNRNYVMWDHIGCGKTVLTVPAGPGVIPNAGRPTGIQIWTQSVVTEVRNTDFGDPTGPPRPVEIRGARNGAFSGQIVAGSDTAIKGLKVTVTNLKGARDGSLPASAVQVRYAVLRGETESYGSVLRRFDGLEEKPPEEVATDKAVGGSVQPVWITVRVPKDAASGRYEGKAVVSADGVKPVEVPITLNIADWTLPDPKDYATFSGLIQSPESLALQYRVDMWSEAHWKLVDRSFELLGRIGAKDVYIPIRARTYFGNEHSMVRWLKQPDGSWKHDFSIVEKYLDTAVKHLGKAPVVVAYAWDLDSGSTYFGGGPATNSAGIPFTVLDPATGKLENQAGPKFGEPAMREFLKPVFDGLRKALAARGLEKSLMVGLCGDRRPGKEAVEDLKAVAPEAKWVVSSHQGPLNIHGQPVGYGSVVWGLTKAPDPSENRFFGWKNPVIQVVHPRHGSDVTGNQICLSSPLAQYRLAAEAALTGNLGNWNPGQGLRGVGRCGADFWPVVGGKGYVVGRYPETAGWHGGDIVGESYPYALWPGRDGPVTTARFEMLREGVQEAEARIFIEKILTDPARKAGLGEDLARRCQDLLDERVRVNRQASENDTGGSGGGSALTWTWFAGSGWQERSERLYALAAEVAGKLGAKQMP